jgi:O-acetylserine/cysteine efflux transporter
LDPISLVFLRYVGCFPIALILVAPFRDRVRLTIGWPRLVALLLLGGPLYHSLLVAGYQHATAGGGALLLSGLLPVFALGLEYLHSGALSRAGLIGAAAILAGLALFGSGSEIPGVSFSAFLIFAVAAAAWALLNTCVKRWRVDPIGLAITLALFAPIFLPIYLIGSPRSELSATTGEIALQIVYHGWLVAIGATALFFTCVHLAGAHVAAVLQVMSPAFSVLFGVAFLSEAVVPTQGIGLMLVIGGVLLTMSAPAREAPVGERVVGPNSLSRSIHAGLAMRTRWGRW